MMARQELRSEEETATRIPKVCADAEAAWELPAEVATEIRALYKRRLPRLRRRRPMDHVVVEALAGRPPTSAGVDVLIAALHTQGRRTWRGRIAAAWLLGYVGLSPAQRVTAMLSLRERLTQKEYAKRGLLWGVASLFSQGFMVPIALMGEWRRMQLHTAVVHSLGRLPEVESIGPVVGALLERRPFRQPSIRAEARRVLPGLLALLTPEQYGQVSAETVRSLCALAYTMEDDGLALAALKALEKVGGGSAVEAVSQLSRDRRDMPAVVAESGRILPVLLERKRQEDQANTLLRAAGEVDPERTLLRAAGGAGEAQPEVLLRATEGEEA